MSWQASKLVNELVFGGIRPEKALSPLAVSVLQRIAYCAQAKDGHSCELSIEGLANAHERTERAIYNCLDELKLGGYVNVERGKYGSKTVSFRFPQLVEHFEAGFKMSGAAQANNLKKMAPESEAGFKILYIDQKSSKDDDDAFTRLRDDLVQIAGREATSNEESVLRGCSTDEMLCAAAHAALAKLRTRFPMDNFNSRNDAAKWLKAVIDDQAKNQKLLREKQKRKYVLEEQPYFTEVAMSIPEIGTEAESVSIAPDFGSVPSEEVQDAPSDDSRVTGVQSNANTAQSFQTLWEKTLGTLKNELTPGAFSNFYGTKAISCDNDRLVVGVRTLHARDVLSARFRSRCEEELTYLARGDMSVEFVCNQAHPGMH